MTDNSVELTTHKDRADAGERITELEGEVKKLKEKLSFALLNRGATMEEKG